MGYTEGASPKGLSVFNDDAQTTADFNQLREDVETIANHKNGTTEERNEASGNEVWPGLLWSDTTDGNVYIRVGDGWQYFGAGNDLRTYGSWNGTARSLNPIIVNGQGDTKTSGTGVQTNNFKKPFPNGCFFVILQPHQNTGQLAASPPVVVEGSVSKNGFQAFFGGRPDAQVFLPYIAFGY
jgi:hypothetical protein